MKRPRQWAPKGFEGTSRWLESTLEVARWENVVRAGRRWGRMGVLLGAALGLVMFAPASWLASSVAKHTGGRLLLAEAEGTIWSGNAVAVLTGGPGSRDARSLPGRLGWRLRPHGLGISLVLSQDCCLPGPVTLTVKPGWKRLSAALVPGVGGVNPGLVGQWPASLLSGLGTPWNTLELTGMLRLHTQGFEVRWADGRLAVQGDAQFTLADVASKVSTLQRLGSYRVSLSGSGQTGVNIGLYTEDGALQLTGSGSVGPSGLRFHGEASASEAEQGALNNLLNIIGRRTGDRSVISIG